MTVTIAAADDHGEVAQTALAMLNTHAEEACHPFVRYPVSLVATTDADVGWLSGHILHDWLYTKYLAVAPRARGAGIGAALMARAEAHARDHGAVGAVVDTYAFQAVRFYLRAGYCETMRLEHADPARTRVFFEKRFV